MKSHIAIRHGTKVSVESGQLKLFCPGPVLTSQRVRHAMSRADIAHRDDLFVELLDRVRARLKGVASAPEHEALVLGGGGTAATEAAFATFIAPEERLLVVSNGAFGERMAEIAVALGIPVSHLRYEWGDRVVLEQITGMLEGDSRIRAVAMVHHETSVGRLNPVVEVGRLLAPRRIRFLVDVVSSLGAEEFDTVRARASVVIGSANKCLHSVAGLGFVLVKHDLWEDTEHVRPRSMYLDLRRYRAAAKGERARPRSLLRSRPSRHSTKRSASWKIRADRCPAGALPGHAPADPRRAQGDRHQAPVRDTGQRLLADRGAVASGYDVRRVLRRHAGPRLPGLPWQGSDQPRHIPRRQHGSPGFGHG
jgi:hypothetical protein